METYTHIIAPVLMFLGLFAALATIRALTSGRVNSLSTHGWSTCQGEVQFGTVFAGENSRRHLFVGRIDYSYVVSGEYYSGGYEKVFLLERTANRFVDRMKKQIVVVRYNPDHPEHSALLKQDQPNWPR